MPVRRTDVYEPWEEQVARGWIKLMNATNVTVYESSDGRVAGSIPSGAPLMLLSTKGNKSGRRRTVTIVYLDGADIGEDDAWFVVASNGGLSRDPAWVRNIQQEPRVRVQIGPTHYDTTASVLKVKKAKQRRLADAVIEQLAQGYRPFGDYQQRASGNGRTIRVARIEKVTPLA
jgi:deazaflavin-dependent oxidoreductase (nitroreductase family)